MERKRRAVIYARVSTDVQTQGSGLGVQIAECERYASDAGLEVVRIFQDEGISGSHGISDRAALDDMIQTLRADRIDYVLVHEMDRLSRDLNVGLTIVTAVTSTQATLVTVATGTEFDNHGALMGLVSLWAAGEDRKRILTRTKRGHLKRAKDGKVAGPPPLGYDRSEDGKLVINEEEAALVRRVYRMYLEEGYHYDTLAARLNAEGIPTKRARANAEGKNKYRGANHWQRSTIVCMLRNPVYKGVYIYGKTRGRVKADKDYTPSAKRPLVQPYLVTAVSNRKFIPHEKIEVEVPAIIDAETWERVQELRKERFARTELAKSTHKYAYNFDGIVRCALCGRVMMKSTTARHTKKHGTKTHAYYVCRNKENACPNTHHTHAMYRIDAEIMARIFPWLKDPALVRRTLNAAVADVERKHEDLQLARRAAEQRVGELQAEIKRARDLLVKGLFTEEDFLETKTSREAAIEAVKKEIANIDRQATDDEVVDDRARLEAVVRCLSQEGFQANDPDLLLWTLFPKRMEHAPKVLNAKKTTAADYLKYGPAIPCPEDDDEGIGRRLLQIIQNLVKYVTIDEQGQIVDYVLRIKDPGVLSSDEFVSENHMAKRNSMTSPS